MIWSQAEGWGRCL